VRAFRKAAERRGDAADAIFRETKRRIAERSWCKAQPCTAGWRHKPKESKLLGEDGSAAIMGAANKLPRA